MTTIQIAQYQCTGTLSYGMDIYYIGPDLKTNSYRRKIILGNTKIYSPTGISI